VTACKLVLRRMCFCWIFSNASPTTYGQQRTGKPLEEFEPFLLRQAGASIANTNAEPSVVRRRVVTPTVDTVDPWRWLMQLIRRLHVDSYPPIGSRQRL